MSHKFEVFIDDHEALAALAPALDQAQRVATESDYDQKGAVFCQVARRIGGGFRITGAFVPPVFAERINAVLLDYLHQSSAGESAK